MAAKSVLFLILFFTCGCAAEFDLGSRTPRRDPCTKVVQTSYVYFYPTCRNALPPLPPEHGGP